MNYEVESFEQVNIATCLVVENQFGLENAGEILKGIKTLSKEIKGVFDPIVQKASQAHKEAIAQRDKYLNPLEQAESIIKKKMSVYVSEQERLEREEKRRIEAELRAKMEEEAKKQAEILKSQGMVEVAQELINQVQEQPVSIDIEKKVEKIEGITYKTSYSFDIVDVSKIKPEFFVLDEKKIAKVVRSMGKDAETIVGGIVVKEEKTISARG